MKRRGKNKKGKEKKRSYSSHTHSLLHAPAAVNCATILGGVFPAVNAARAVIIASVTSPPSSPPLTHTHTHTGQEVRKILFSRFVLRPVPLMHISPPPRPPHTPMEISHNLILLLLAMNASKYMVMPKVYYIYTYVFLMFIYI